MPRKKTERERKLAAIEGALKFAQTLSWEAIYGSLAEMDEEIEAAREAIRWLRRYPASLENELARLVRDQFCKWAKLHPDAAVTDNHRAWALAYREVFETGYADLRRKM